MEERSEEDVDDAPKRSGSPKLPKMDHPSSFDITLDPPTPGIDDQKDQREFNNISGHNRLDYKTGLCDDGNTSGEEIRPPLPPRPSRLQSTAEPTLSPLDTLQRLRKSGRPQLQSAATTAVSLTDIHTQVHQDGLRGTYSTPTKPKQSDTSGSPYRGNSLYASHNGSDAGETSSIRSYVPTLEAGGDVESLLGEVLGSGQDSPAWELLGGHTEVPDPFEMLTYDKKCLEGDFEQEFNEVGELFANGGNEEKILSAWKSKLKHFLILSSAGKPIYTRHGDENVVSGFIGIIQTIISFYQGAQDPLRGFTAGGVRFVIMAESNLYLVAISRLKESDSQLRVQLEALYMQILSTLTLPNLTHMFAARPSTDLRRPLEGTEPLLSALADTFTKGSPPTLLSALECLIIRKTQRQLINNILLKARTESLLYGLIVAGGRLVSVVRPKKHSLHPSDLQLIFNMLFEAKGIKAGGGENWIPLCLPGFNSNGYLYMYVSFLNARKEDGESPEKADASSKNDDEVAVLLISASKESFHELKKMRDEVVEQLEGNGSMEIIKSAVKKGRLCPTDIVPGTVLRHFLYKSRGNVQFTMPSYEPHFNTLLARRRLISLYHTLHASVHTKNAHLKVHHCVSRGSISLAWVSPLFELFCVAGPTTSRNALAQSANKVVQWVRREEERVFIIGGAVF
ncbi:MAG: Vacuolar fusion protein mon1 [Candelina mexicana]|nr:MAG: Vacuolar fusion protein mon1 [Candelina mexicana]